MIRRLRPWHWAAMSLLALLVVALLWFSLAYAGLPRLWSHHEHKKIGRRDEIISYTVQDIPGDPINLHIHGDASTIISAYRRAGWSVADNVSLRTAVLIGLSVVAQRSYPTAPVSPLFVKDKVQDLAFERDEGKSADKRHHVRLWQIAPNDWLGAATFDRGVGLSFFTLQITHHIGPDIDRERALSTRVLLSCGGSIAGTESSRLPMARWHRNGGGDKYYTDGKIADLAFQHAACV